MLLKYKTVMMTGGASGIGRATVLMLAKEGARVLLCDVNEAGAKETIEMADGAPVEFLKLELTDGASVDACAKTGDRARRRQDRRIRQCRRLGPHAAVRRGRPGVHRQGAGHQPAGAAAADARAVPGHDPNGGGKIVFVASDAGRVGSLGETPYSAAKGGIIGFTKSLAREGARHKITVNCVCPGPTDTPLFHANPERMREALLKAIPFRRLATPDDIAGAILYFAGPDQRLRHGPDPDA